MNYLQGFYVPRTGFEPAHLAALLPESSASTNFATWASLIRGCKYRKERNPLKKRQQFCSAHPASAPTPEPAAETSEPSETSGTSPPGFAAFHPINNTPMITSTVPATCSTKNGSPSTKWACKIVETGPTLVTIAALLAPIRFIPADNIKDGITVATSASA